MPTVDDAQVGSIPTRRIAPLEDQVERISSLVLSRLFEHFAQASVKRFAAPDEFLTTKQAAKLAGLKASTRETWRVKGRHNPGPPWVRIGAAIRYRRSELERYLTACTEGRS